MFWTTDSNLEDLDFAAGRLDLGYRRFAELVSLDRQGMPQLAIIITSYSIHYTKLYEW